MKVETKNASLDTMAVTIQALHVSGKQMTLAVFRQLPMTSAFHDSGELRDLAFWGLIRYQIKDESALWAVASAGGILYRCDAVPRRKSIALLEREEKGARDDLKRYMVWEPIEIVWAKWRSDGHTQTNMPTLPRPEYEIYFKTGQGEFYEYALRRATVACAMGKTLEKSIAKLAELPQLYIAV